MHIFYLLRTVYLLSALSLVLRNLAHLSFSSSGRQCSSWRLKRVLVGLQCSATSRAQSPITQVPLASSASSAMLGAHGYTSPRKGHTTSLRICRSIAPRPTSLHYRICYSSIAPSVRGHKTDPFTKTQHHDRPGQFHDMVVLPTKRQVLLKLRHKSHVLYVSPRGASYLVRREIEAEDTPTFKVCPYERTTACQRTVVRTGYRSRTRKDDPF